MFPSRRDWVAGAYVDLGLDIAGRASYSRALNRGSLATGSATFSLQNDGVYSILLEIGITWGIATGYFTLYPGASGFAGEPAGAAAATPCAR